MIKRKSIEEANSTTEDKMGKTRSNVVIKKQAVK